MGGTLGDGCHSLHFRLRFWSRLLLPCRTTASALCGRYYSIPFSWRTPLTQLQALSQKAMQYIADGTYPAQACREKEQRATIVPRPAGRAD